MTAHYYRALISYATTDSWSGSEKNRKGPNLCSRVPNTLVTLTHPYLLVTFRLKPFFFWHLTFCGMGAGRTQSLPGGNMKKTGLFVLVLVSLLATAAWAQGGADAISGDAPQGTAPTSASFPTMRVQTPTYADLYCAGFISKQNLPDANFVAGGLQTPTTTKFTRGDMIYLEGTGYSAGAEYEDRPCAARCERIRDVSRPEETAEGNRPALRRSRTGEGRLIRAARPRSRRSNTLATASIPATRRFRSPRNRP